VLQYGEQAALMPAGAGITPSTQPTLLTTEQTNLILSTTEVFESLAREAYGPTEQYTVPNTFTYTISLRESQPLLWLWGWCAADQTTLDDNLSQIEIHFSLNEEDISLDNFLPYPYESSGQMCLAYLMGVTDWAVGQHKAVTTVSYLEPLNDGVGDYPAGQQVFEYNIYIKP
jgi:hypothetical protein